MFEFFKTHKRGLKIGGTVAAGALVLAACGNFSGEGNEFEVEGKVDHVGEQSITAVVYDINETHGDAQGWFEVGNTHQFHDNCDCHGTWNGRKKYGIVLNYSGVEITLDQVRPGSCVEFTGKIRSNQEGKTHHDRPVYDIAQLVPCS